MSKKKTKLANHLRNHMTLPEVLLWNQIKSGQMGYDFNRQFCLGPYIADFYCREVRLVVEVDGLVHELKAKSDAKRDKWLATNRVEVLRIPAKSVLKSPYSAAQRIKERLVELEASKDPERDTSF